MALLLFFTWILVSAGSQQGLPIHWLAVSVLLQTGLVLAMLLASMFAVQAATVAAVASLLILGNWAPILSLILGVCACAATGPTGRDVLRHHLWFKVWYWRNVRSATSATGRNDLRRLWEACRHASASRVLFETLRGNSFLPAILGGQLVIALAAVLLMDGGSLNVEVAPQDFDSSVFAINVGALLMAFVITSFGRFRSLGQSERYVEYALPIAGLLLALTFGQGASFIAILATAPLTLVGLSIVLVVYRRRGLPAESASEGLWEVINWVCRHQAHPRILVNPVKLAYAASALAREHGLSAPRFYFRYLLTSGDFGYEYFTRDITGSDGRRNEALVLTDPLFLVQEYRLTAFLIHSSCREELMREAHWRDLMVSPPGFEVHGWAVWLRPE